MRKLVLIPVGVVAAACSLLLLAHRAVPGSAGSLVDSGLPWLAVPILLLVGVAAVTRRLRVVGVALVPAIIWAALFVPTLTDRAQTGDHDLRVASLNLGRAAAGDALPPLLRQRPDVLVLQEITVADRSAVTKILAAGYPHHYEAGTVAIFSRLPIADEQPVDIQIGWTRAIAATVSTAAGPVRVYAAHLASARVDRTTGRDRTLAALAAAAHADPSPRLVLAGDLNTATTDRQFAELAPLRDSQEQAGTGFGFTWPAALPVVRPDHILERGLLTRRSWTLRVPGSDHQAVLADLDVVATTSAAE
ncbi:endonuclease/exonuclease/phosphatase family protein [Paractinoplanes ferrugineus]|uniref:endonuclease/exonuclease/phosphatase family protein n=1 Tax=Paractinoplanes ferrugineus TaxID=113564 RepID=UPI001943CF1C|nr:endonuclease/exonuclease/phosphatase family protein [Actinoplanes ferrugineus]